MRPILAGNIWQGTRLPRGGQTTHAPARRSDVSVILTDDGKIVEWVKYTPYGEPIGVPAGDVNGDFAYDEDDEAIIYDFIENGGTYDVRLNPTLTGQVDHADIAHARSITNTYQYLGRGVLSSEGVQNRFGYAGYRYDHHLSGGAGAGRHLYHVRHRVYQAHIGRWATRDPLGYVDGMSLYGYVQAQPIVLWDMMGLVSVNRSQALCGSGQSFLGTSCQPPIPSNRWWDPPTYVPPRRHKRPASCNPSTVCPDVTGCSDRQRRKDAPPIFDNACGPGWLKVPNLWFKDCCSQHDNDYQDCGMSKEEAEKRFCRCMRDECKSLPNRLDRARCRIAAETYCTAVDAFGCDSYCSSQRQQCVCCDPPNPHPDCDKSQPTCPSGTSVVE
jgi:RHS repeat-associated protein